MNAELETTVEEGTVETLPSGEGNETISADNQVAVPEDFQVGEDVRTFLFQNKLTDAETLKKGYMQAGDYTKKTQELSARAKKLADEQTAPYQHILRLIDEDDEVFEYIKGKLNPQEIEEKVAEEKVTGVENPELKELRKTVSQLQERFKTEDNNKAYNEAKTSLERELEANGKTYPLMSRAEVLSQIVAYPDASVEELCKMNHESKLKFKDSVIKEYVKSKGIDAEGAGVGGIGGLPPKGGVGVIGKEPKTFEEADKRARQRLANLKKE